MSESHHTTTPSSKEKRFLEAHDLYSDGLLRYFTFRLSDMDRATELVQETFMKTWNYMRDDFHEGKVGGDIENMRAFLYKTASNMVIDEYRKRKPADSLEALSEQSGFDPSFNDTDRWIDRLDGTQALSLLRRLPEQYGEAILMRYVEELSLSEMAKITGESENTLAVRVHRGIEKLKIIFNHEQSH